MSRIDRLGPLRERPFRLLFAARTVSGIGSNVATVAYAFAILDLTGSASDLGLTFLARTVPVLLFVLVGGVLADRLPRRRIMVAADTARALSQGAVAALLLTGHARLWELMVLQVLYGAGEAMFTPASRGLIPQLVEPERLQQANALMSFTGNANSILGPALGGVLVATVGSGAALAADAGSFALGVVLLLGIPAGARVAVAAEPVWQAFGSGLRAVRERRWLSASLANDCLFQLIVLPSLFVLGPALARTHLHGARSWAAMLVALGAGSIVGDVVSLRLRPRRPLFVSRLVVLLVAPGMILLAFGENVVAVVAGFALAGIGFSVANTLWFTLLQQSVPDDLRSRIASFDTLVSRALLPIGYGLVGVAGGRLGNGTVLAGAAVAMVVAQLATAALPSVRALDTGVRPVSDPISA